MVPFPFPPPVRAITHSSFPTHGRLQRGGDSVSLGGVSIGGEDGKRQAWPQRSDPKAQCMRSVRPRAGLHRDILRLWLRIGLRVRPRLQRQAGDKDDPGGQTDPGDTSDKGKPGDQGKIWHSGFRVAMVTRASTVAIGSDLVQWGFRVVMGI